MSNPLVATTCFLKKKRPEKETSSDWTHCFILIDLNKDCWSITTSSHYTAKHVSPRTCRQVFFLKNRGIFCAFWPSVKTQTQSSLKMHNLENSFSVFGWTGKQVFVSLHHTVRPILLCLTSACRSSLVYVSDSCDGACAGVFIANWSFCQPVLTYTPLLSVYRSPEDVLSASDEHDHHIRPFIAVLSDGSGRADSNLKRWWFPWLLEVKRRVLLLTRWHRIPCSTTVWKALSHSCSHLPPVLFSHLARVIAGLLI